MGLIIGCQDIKPGGDIFLWPTSPFYSYLSIFANIIHLLSGSLLPQLSLHWQLPQPLLSMRFAKK